MASTAAMLTGTQTAEIYATGIVNGHMDKYPARAVGVLLAVTGNLVAWIPETAQFPDIQVQQVTGFALRVI